MRWVVGVIIILLVVFASAADAQRTVPRVPSIPRTTPMPAPMPTPMPTPTPTPLPRIDPPPRVEPVDPYRRAPTQCVGHYEIGARECSALEEAIQGLAWEVAQDRLEDWANDPSSSPDPQCVRSERYWVTC